MQEARSERSSPRRVSDFRRRLEADTGSYPPTWRPKAGAVVSGPLVRYNQATDSFGVDRVIAVIDDEVEGELSVWLSSCVLYETFKRHHFRPGEWVGIKCHGKRESADGRPYWHFTVKAQRDQETAEPDWANLRPPEDPGASVYARGPDADPDAEDPFV